MVNGLVVWIAWGLLLMSCSRMVDGLVVWQDGELPMTPPSVQGQASKKEEEKETNPLMLFTGT